MNDVPCKPAWPDPWSRWFCLLSHSATKTCRSCWHDFLHFWLGQCGFSCSSLGQTECCSMENPGSWTWNLSKQFSCSRFFYRGFLYIPGGAAFLPRVGSCDDVAILCIVDEVSWCWACFLNHPRFASVGLTGGKTWPSQGGQWWQKTNMSTLQFSWAFNLVQSLKFLLEGG